ncbi:MAG: hypothetical protein GY943_33875, partial [Chloroflexi bacterium]|nr:hypothetical protein [Chloroflexota bacterium]
MKIENNHLHEMLNTLQEVPARDAEAMTQGRAQFLAEAEALRPLPPQPIPTPLQKIKSIFSTPSIQRVAVGFALFLAFLIVGGTGVTFAAEDSLPGDPLYGVKLTVEQARLRNPLLNAQEKEALLVNFTEERIVELDSLVQQERYDDLETAVSTFHRYVSQGRDLIPAQENDPFDTLVDQATQILAPVPEN